MCLTLYLFTDNQVDEIDFDELNPAFWVQKITEGLLIDVQQARNWVPEKSNIYYMGSNLGCGCGWFPINDEHDEDEVVTAARDRKNLMQLLGSKEFNGSHLIACWEGGEGEPLKRREAIRLPDIANLQFEFEECVDYVLWGLEDQV